MLSEWDLTPQPSLDTVMHPDTAMVRAWPLYALSLIEWAVLSVIAAVRLHGAPFCSATTLMSPVLAGHGKINGASMHILCVLLGVVHGCVASPALALTTNKSMTRLHLSCLISHRAGKEELAIDTTLSMYKLDTGLLASTATDDISTCAG